MRRVSGDRSAVLIVGPSRCGKTAGIISSILTWDGPVILMSVKTDLIAPTLARRAQLGEIKIFDPTDTTGLPHYQANWSPLRGAHTQRGALAAARGLVDAAPREGSESMTFWTKLAEQALWPMMYAAATAKLTMADVVSWTKRMDRPVSAAAEGTVSAILDRELVSSDPHRRSQATAALDSLKGIWELDDRARGSVYATAITMVEAWQDPAVANSARGCTIDLPWLLDATPIGAGGAVAAGGSSAGGARGWWPRRSGEAGTLPVARANTLYVSGPIHEFKRSAVVFGGLIKDLLDQAYETTNRTGQPLRDLLIVMDECGNTPVQWLPEIASTCSGIGIQLVTIWQSFAQINETYARKTGTVITNHGTKILFSGISDEDTIRYANLITGELEINQTSVTANRSWNNTHQSINESARTTPLIPGWLLRQIPRGHALLLHGNLPPAHLKAHPWYNDRGLRHLATTGLPPRRGPWSKGLVGTR